VHVLAGSEMHLVPGISCGDRERDQRIGVSDRGKAGKQHTHADESTPDNPALGDAFAHGDGNARPRVGDRHPPWTLNASVAVSVQE
jgi:hypothetical protein